MRRDIGLLGKFQTKFEFQRIVGILRDASPLPRHRCCAKARRYRAETRFHKIICHGPHSGVFNEIRYA